MDNGRLLLAVPGPGWLRDEFLRICGLAGLECAGGLLHDPGEKIPDITVREMAPAAMLEGMGRGEADAAILEIADFAEHKSDRGLKKNQPVCTEPVSLPGVAACRLVIVAPPESQIYTPANIRDTRISSPYPALLQGWMKSNGGPPDVIVTAAEPASDRIPEITPEGEFLDAGRLAVKSVLFTSTAVLVRGVHDIGPDNKDILSSLAMRLFSTAAEAVRRAPSSPPPVRLVAVLAATPATR